MLNRFRQRCSFVMIIIYFLRSSRSSNDLLKVQETSYEMSVAIGYKVEAVYQD